MKHVRMMNTHIEGLTGIAQHNKGLEWVIKGVREKFEQKTYLYSDPFYVDNYKFQGWAKFNTEDNNGLEIFVVCV